ncbi:Protein of unknown function [Pyronema omphalodes CBS 100304]|uniref:Uncharacterized protein n=1 Tax=Pyronema omphalodes (strain CBS 100304) TaxID=1076935 RepID=U4LN93_PYROM|nr:Protein of unknown function [Pyronema omphalodes CBS 100304]
MQVFIDTIVILAVRFFGAGFVFTLPIISLLLITDTGMTVWILRGDPQPIDVLIKNALRGVA